MSEKPSNPESPELTQELDDKLTELAIIWAPFLDLTIDTSKEEENKDLSENIYKGPKSTKESFEAYLRQQRLRSMINGCRKNMKVLKGIINTGNARIQAIAQIEEIDFDVIKEDEIEAAYQKSLPLIRRIEFLYRKLHP